MENAGTSVGKMVLPTLSLSRIISGMPSVLIGILLIEIGQTFNTSVGVTGQVRTISSIVAFFSAIILGGLTVRYNPKSILVLGIGFILISAILCSISPSYLTFLLVFPLSGIGISFTNPMGSTLIAHYYSDEERANALGWLSAGGALSWVVGAQIITYLAGVGSWRYSYQVFVIPLLVIGLVLSYRFLPRPQSNRNQDDVNLTDGVRSVIGNRSALWCLSGSILSMASFQLVLVYSGAFLRQEYLVSREITSILLTLSALSYVFGSIVSGRVVRRVGVKNVTVIFLFLSGIMLAVFTLSSFYWLSLGVYFLGPFCFGVSFPANITLLLGQDSEYQGTMMAFNAAFNNIGSALGAAVGGYIIVSWGYVFLGVVLGSFSILAALVIYLLVNKG